MSLRALTDCRFVVSPFLALEETSWRLLLREYGAQLCYTTPINACDVLKETCLSETLLKIQPDRPIITQLFSSDPQTLVEAVRKVSECCDAVDITYQDDSALTATTLQQRWSSWLELVQQVRSQTDAAVVCKLPLEPPDDVNDLLDKIRVVENAGCKFILLHGVYCGNSARPSFLDKSHWDLIKTVRENASIPLVVDVNCASLHNVSRFLEHTGVQGVSIAEPLKGDPAFFLQKKPPMLEVAREYLALCELCSTLPSDAKDCILRLARVFFSVYPDGLQELMEAQDLQSIALVLDELEKKMATLSRKRVKALEMLHKKKEKYRTKKAEKRLQSKESAGLGSIDCQEGEDSGADEHVAKKERKRIQKERAKTALSSGLRVALDLSLGDKMNDKEISKLAGQLRHLYGSNMRSPSPFHVVFTSLDPHSKIYKEACRQNQGFHNFLVEMTSKHFTDLYAAEDIVFLTPDSTNVLQKLEMDKVYIIGGLVDHQVLPHVTQTRAKTHRITSARLPLDEYMERREGGGNFTYSKVLTVNQVFDILLKFHETQDWACALLAGVPYRKGFVLKSSQDSKPNGGS